MAFAQPTYRKILGGHMLKDLINTLSQIHGLFDPKTPRNLGWRDEDNITIPKNGH
jgi:hypothetical protein